MSHPGQLIPLPIPLPAREGGRLACYSSPWADGREALVLGCGRGLGRAKSAADEDKKWSSPRMRAWECEPAASATGRREGRGVWDRTIRRCAAAPAPVRAQPGHARGLPSPRQRPWPQAPAASAAGRAGSPRPDCVHPHQPPSGRVGTARAHAPSPPAATRPPPRPECNPGQALPPTYARWLAPMAVVN
jgi:hypothetical protein